MQTITHIYCSTGGGVIKYAIAEGLIKGNDVIGFFDDLSVGPISSLSETEERVNWLKTNLYPYENEAFLEDFKDYHNNFYERISKVSGDEIYLWHGNNSRELCNLMYILTLIKDMYGKIYTIDVSEKVYQISKRRKYSPRTVGEILPEKLNDFLPFSRAISKEVYQKYVQLWSKLKNENSNLRVLENDHVFSVVEDYFDKIILTHVSSRFAHCARTVGEVYGKVDKFISDDFIFWRILELIKKNKLTFMGKFGVMREMKIKRV